MTETRSHGTTSVSSTERRLMAKMALLNNIDHPDLKVITRFDAAYGDSVNQAAVYPTEFSELQREYPIFFRKDEEGAFYCVILLGLDKGENLFLDGARWQARYVPAIHQRGPFMLGFQNQ